MELTNKTIVLTGATKGIGYQLLNQLNSHNKLIVLGSNSQRLASLKQQFTDLSCYQVDLADLDKVKQIAQQINDKYRQVDVLINNAAIQNTATFDSGEFKPELIVREVNVNFSAICYLIYYLQGALRQSSPGIVLNINSGLALAPKTSSAVYCACKSALNSLSQSLSYQFEDKQINVLQAFLPLVDTSMTQGRGSNKLSAEQAALSILQGLERQHANNYIGKVKLLPTLLRLWPSLAKRLLKGV